MSAELIRSEAAIVEGRLRKDVRLVCSAGKIVEVCTEGGIPGTETHSEADVEGTLLPGWIDLQVNGSGGRGVHEATPEALDAVAVAAFEGGAACFLPTLITARFEELLERTRAVGRWIRERRKVPRAGQATPLGLHLEGPFLEVGGAHDVNHFVDPTPARVEALLEAAQGELALVTLAPARVGAARAVEMLVAEGCAVFLGHAHRTEAFGACVDAGARGVTHLFNAMSGLHHRDPGIVGATFDDPRVAASLIVDGHHVHPSVVRTALRCLGPERLILVTDAMAAAGMPDGDYELGPDHRVRLEGGAVRDTEGRLAGSALSLAAAVRCLGEILGEVDPRVVAAATSRNPARVLADAQRGSIAVGMRAEFAVLSPDGSARAWVR